MKITELKKDLEWRGLLKDIINENSLENIIKSEGKFYIGIDPTADSIHIGHYLVLILAKILNMHGLKPILVLGGFTGMIGDPSGRNSERELVDFKSIENNTNQIEKQLIDFSKKLEIIGLEIFNNIKIYKDMSIIEIYQKYGKLFNINTMLSKESVKNRINGGISYTEFSYQIFQAIDFLYLYENKDVKLQLGGSDQWGNITAGTELIRKIHGKNINVSGITINLLTDENNNKIGKTQGVPIWLDKNKTSVYTLFQFFINQSDKTAIKLLSQATIIEEKKFIEIISKHKLHPKNKFLQNELARIFISTAYSIKDFENAKNISNILFKEKYKEIIKEDLEVLKMIPSIKNKNISLMDLLIENKKISSRREYREFLANGSIKINGNLINDDNLILDNEFLLKKFVFINIGKKNKILIWK